ncbi:kininogen-1-like, partial [Nycticebus coucang]|uniref:kininogen-1-like n=1 Tax=Nycticebus coucang TaxID=9470 RepID=UPI00234DB275
MDQYWSEGPIRNWAVQQTFRIRNLLPRYSRQKHGGRPVNLYEDHYSPALFPEVTLPGPWKAMEVMFTDCRDQMAGGVASEIVQMALSKSSRTFEKTSQRRAMPIGALWTSLTVTDSTPRETSKGNYEIDQTLGNSEEVQRHGLPASLTQDSVSKETDCNDEEAFKAVDTVLKKYNRQNRSGDQCVLHRITRGTKVLNPDTLYTMKYQIKEGDCPVPSGKTWQDCDYKNPTEAATGECTATVGMRGNKKFSVATQTCHITPAEGPVVTAQYDCLGCVHPISTDSPDLEPILRHSIQRFNNNSNNSHLFVLSEVKRAQRQVAAGWNFEVTYSIAQTNCSKEKF